ncbi:MAG: MerR family transcriptional regulator [Desulfovibrio sp.]|nr:MerR family transcriptional regulator [Desulfovibrio sp.]MBI4961442.1 MerR family transcriptional regulator [Desulfovibrio sp.]
MLLHGFKAKESGGNARILSLPYNTPRPSHFPSRCGRPGRNPACPNRRRRGLPVSGEKPKKTYKIGQIAGLLGLKPFVLRFWETEFPALEPIRTPKGQRVYTEAHLRLLKTIQRLLHEEGMTLEGARRKLAERERGNQLKTLVERELLAIRSLLDPKD